MSFINIVNSDATIQSLETGPKEVVYQPNFQAFHNWAHNHRQHQMNAIQATQGQKEGFICLPTGTGKTRVQVHLHAARMIEMCEQPKPENGVFVIAAHRLALCTQLLEDFVKVSVSSGIPFDILYVGSDRFPEDRVHARFKNKGFNSKVNAAKSTTQKNEITHFVRNAHYNNRHVVCVSTYHSYNKLAGLPRIEVATYDEAHTIVGDDNFRANIDEVRPIINRNYFFTATPRIDTAGTQGRGMNNASLFGEILFAAPPRQLINAGEIVAPKIHIIQTQDVGNFDNHTMLVKTVTTGYAQHKALVKQSSAEPDKIGAKMLITTTGNKEMFELHNDSNFRQYCAANNIKVFAVSAENGAFFNFEQKSRDAAMQMLHKLDDTEDAILLHINILTEGIDLPSITGVMPFRELDKTKLLQTIGRAGRLLRTDRKRIYAGELAPNDYAGYVKPCSWVILPEHFRSLGNAQVMEDAIRTIINTYEIPVDQYTHVERFRAATSGGLPPITPPDQSTRRDKESNLIHQIEDILVEGVHEPEATPEEKLAKLKRLFLR